MASDEAARQSPGRRTRCRSDSCFLLGVWVLEYVIQADTESAGYLEGHLEGWRVFALLDGDDRLAGGANSIGEIRLRHLAIDEPERPYRVRDVRRLYHFWNGP